jgi:signal transduction histidine kinase
VEISRESWRSWAFDALIALFLAFVSMTVLVSIESREDLGQVPLGVALLAVHSGVVVFRRRAPVAVLAVNLATGVAVCALGYPFVVLGVAVLVALYTVAARRERTVSLPALGVVVAAMTGIVVLAQSAGDPSTIIGNAIGFGVVWFLGDSQRTRRAYVAQLEERTTQLEQARDELARRAVAEERLRIARELHDIVAHSMGVIAVQAGVGAHVIDARPEEAKRSLQTIEDTSKSALGEIRRMLGLLRADGDAPETQPSPGLDDLSALVDEMKAAGMDVDLSLDSPPHALSVGVELTIFRLVQEALTNVLKHARARNVRVSVWFNEDGARVEVVDDGVGPTGRAGGHGIVGMTERVAMYGGEFAAGPLSEGGFRVAATIPLEGTRR